MTTNRPSASRLAPDTLLYLTAAFVWVTVWRVQDLVPAIGKLRIGLIIEIMLAAVLLSQTQPIRSLRWRKSKLFAIPFLLLGIMIVGLPTNLWRGQAVTFITGDYAASLLVMAAVATAVRERRDLNWLAFAHLVGAAIYALWVFKFAHVASDGRIAGSVFYDANDIALLLISAVPFAIYFARPGAKPLRRAFSVGALVLFIFVIVKSGSRGGFIALIAVTAFVAIRYRAIPKRIRVGAVVGGFLVLNVFASATYWNMMRSILHPQDDYNLTSDVGRKAIWKRGVGYMLGHPVVGVGAAAFPQAEGMISETAQQFAAEGRGLKWSTAHNSFVLVGAELGVTGLTLFVGMFVIAFTQLGRVRRDFADGMLVTQDDEAFAQALYGALIAFCFAGFFVSAAYFPWLYVLMGMIVAQLAILRRRASQLGKVRPITEAAMIASARAAPERRTLRPTWHPAA